MGPVDRSKQQKWKTVPNRKNERMKWKSTANRRVHRTPHTHSQTSFHGSDNQREGRKKSSSPTGGAQALIHHYVVLFAMKGFDYSFILLYW
jgi:hypothetical protein